MSAKQHEARNEKCEDIDAYLKITQLLLPYIANRLSPTSCIKPGLKAGYIYLEVSGPFYEDFAFILATLPASDSDV